MKTLSLTQLYKMPRREIVNHLPFRVRMYAKDGSVVNAFLGPEDDFLCMTGFHPNMKNKINLLAQVAEKAKG